METTEDGSLQPPTSNKVPSYGDTESLTPCHHPDSLTDRVGSHQTSCPCEHGESISCDSDASYLETSFTRAGVDSTSTTMLDLVTENKSPTCSVTTLTLSDGISSDCSGDNRLLRASQSGSNGSLNGECRPCSAIDGVGGDTRPNRNSISDFSAAEWTTTHNGDYNVSQVNAVPSQTMTSHIHKQAQSALNGSCPEQQGAFDVLSGNETGLNKNCSGVETKLPNGGLLTGDSCGKKLIGSTAPGYPGKHVPSSCSYSQLGSTSAATGESRRSSRAETEECSKAQTPHGVDSQPVPSSTSTPHPSISQGAPKQTSTIFVSDTLSVPSVEVEEVEEEEEEEPEEGAGEAASDLGSFYHASPGARLEACPDEAFGHHHNTQHFVNISLGSRNTYESNRRQSAPGQLPQSPEHAAEEPSDLALQSRKPGIAEYLGRGLFTRRSGSAPGWKLFGKVPLRESPTKDSKIIKQESVPGALTSVSSPDLLTSGEYEARQGTRSTSGNSPTQHAAGRRKNLEFEPLSTTALILEDRPASLPAKSVEEAHRHRQQYDEMVAEAKKRELKDAQRRQRQMKERFKQEENIVSAMLVWNNDILPHWDAMKSSRRARDLWWQGLPPNVRGRVWSLAIGNELNITPELYGIFLSRAKEKWRMFGETGSESEVDDGASLVDRESSLELIKLDISRTFPSLFIFQKGGPYHDLLHSILGAYTCYRPDVGYVQGMSFIAAVLILNMEEADAFICFANLLNKPCQMAFFRVDHELMLKFFEAFEVFFEENLPRLFGHFQSSNLTPDLYLIDWIFSLYTKPLPLDVACRVWDVFCRDGEEFLFRTGLGILRLFQDVLIQMDFIHIAQFLARLPDEELLSDRLFSCIAATSMLSGNRKWSQVFSSLMKDTKEDT